MARLCITADDYGMAPCVNAAIEELAAGGHISAVAIMVHPDADLGTLDRLRATGVALGLHAVCTQERPLLERVVGTPLAPAGHLLDSPYGLLAALLRRPALGGLLGDELAAQADRYAALGMPFDFINSHEHVHETPLMWRSIAGLVAARRPAALRAAHRQPLTASKQGVLAALSRLSQRLAPAAVPCWLSPLGAGQAGQLDLAAIEELVSRGLAWHADGDALPELVVHPATDDAPLQARYGDKAGARRAEYEVLRSPALAALWRRLEVVLDAPRATP